MIPYTPSANASVATSAAPTTSGGSMIPFTPGQTTTPPSNSSPLDQIQVPSWRDALVNGFLGALKMVPGLDTIVSSAQALPQAPAQVASQFSAGIDKVKAGFEQTQAPLKSPADLANPIEAGLKIGSGAITAATAPIAPALAPVGDTINTIGDLIGSIPAVQRFAMSPAGDATQRITEDIGDAANIAGAVAMLPDALASARGALTSTPEQQASSLQGKVQKVAQDWQTPTVPGKMTNPASYEKAAAVLEKDPSIPQFLAEQGISPGNNIEGNLHDSRYATADTADALRTTAGKLSRDALRPSLQFADYTVPSTDVKEISVPDNLIQAQGRGVTPDDVEAIKAKIQTKLDALQRKYPNGMGLTDLHDEKITYAQNGKFSPVGDASVDNNAIANRSISAALGKLVEDKAPESLPVNEFNQYLQKYYQAADYLDQLNNKKAPQSLVSYVARKTAQVVGAGVGHSIGGGILGGVGGYVIGGALEHALENLTLPMRYQFLQNLKITNPAAYDAVVNFVADQQTQGLARPALPAASTIQLGPAQLGTTRPGAPITPPQPLQLKPGLGSPDNPFLMGRSN